MLDRIQIECVDCGKHHLVDDWKVARTMINEEKGHSAYHYVYLIEKTCDCGLLMTVEGQGLRHPFEEIVSKWYYRFFECSEVFKVAYDSLE